MAEVGRIQIEVDARQVEKATRALNALGLKATSTGKKVGQYENQTKQAEKATEKMTKSSRKLTRMFGLLSAGLGGLTFAGLARQVGQATTQLNNIEATMRVAAGSSRAAGEQIAFIREESERLGLFFPAVAKQMAQFSAAARGTSITGEELKTIFTGISEASRAMGLTAPEAEGAMKALQQMMSKGKVSAEELRQQLGERMPGSIQIMAQSLDVTTQKLFDMMENGELLSDEVLPKFGRELQNVFGEQAVIQADKIAASIQRLRNAFFDLLSQGDLKEASQSIRELSNQVSSDAFQQVFDDLVQFISNLGLAVAKNLDSLQSLAKIVAALGFASLAKKVVLAGESMVVFANKQRLAAGMTVKLNGALGVTRKLLTFLGRSPLGIVLTTASSIAALSQWFRKTTESSNDFNDSIRNTSDSLDNLQEKIAFEDARKNVEEARKDYQAYLDVVEEIQDRGTRIAEALSGERFFVNFSSQRARIEDLKEELASLVEESQEYENALEQLKNAEREYFAARFLDFEGDDRQEFFQNRRQSVLAEIEAQNKARISAKNLIAEYDEGLAQSIEYASNVQELSEAFITLGFSKEEAAAKARQLLMANNEVAESQRTVNDLIDEGIDLISDIPAVDLLPPGQRDRIAKGNAELQRARDFLRDMEGSSNDAGKAIGDLEIPMSKAKQDAKEIADAIEGDLSKSITDVIMDVNSLSDAFASLAEQIARTIIQQQVADPLAQGIGDFAQGFFQNLFSTGNPGATVAQGGSAAPPPSVRQNANGGNVYGGTPSIVGERGPELFVPGQDGRIVPNHEMGGTGNVTVNVINEGGQPLSVSGQKVKKNVNGETNIDVMVKQSIDRLDSQGQLDGMFRRHGGTRTGQF